MEVRERWAVLAAIGALCVAPGLGHAQAELPAPPAQEQAPGADPAPEGQPPILPLPDTPPRFESGPGMRGADCEHSRSPGIGV